MAATKNTTNSTASRITVSLNRLTASDGRQLVAVVDDDPREVVGEIDAEGLLDPRHGLGGDGLRRDLGERDRTTDELADDARDPLQDLVRHGDQVEDGLALLDRHDLRVTLQEPDGLLVREPVDLGPEPGELLARDDLVDLVLHEPRTESASGRRGTPGGRRVPEDRLEASRTSSASRPRS
jgi:hypothetical protein